MTDLWNIREEYDDVARAIDTNTMLSDYLSTTTPKQIYRYVGSVWGDSSLGAGGWVMSGAEWAKLITTELKFDDCIIEHPTNSRRPDREGYYIMAASIYRKTRLTNECVLQLMG
jgi:hypothetical protein